ncbi:MAG: TonB-dependent receptor [Deltaproteobacteria bacterium]|nr:TonB-dependent receptor [Deltaproteobacteria bacterium]
MGTVGNEQYFGHIDVGGPILDGKLAYRINLLAQDGETSIKFQEKERQLASIALDWNVTPDLLVQVNASVGKIHIRGRQGTFYFENPSINAFRDGTYYPDLLESYENTTFFTGVTSPPPGLPDPTTPFASKDTFADAKTRFTGANIHYKLNDWISFRAAGVIYIRDMLEVWGNTFFTLNPDVFRADIRARRGYGKSKGAYGYVDVNFQTGPLEHKLTAGANGYYTLINQQTATFQSPNLVPGETNRYMYYYYSGRFSDPSLISNFDLDQYDVLSLLAPRRHHTSDTKNYNLIIGDDIKITDQWSVMLGVNYSTLRTRGFNANTGIRTSQYKSSAWTPTIAVLYKPLPYVTTYASYIESLEAGVNVPATSSYLNAGETLPPFSSSQYEFGVKAKLGGMFLTAAFYQINKALQYADTSRNLYVQDGRQRHRGFEFTARGKLTDDLTLMGGFNITRAKRLKSSNPRLDGLAMRNVPKFSGKIYLEYDIPVIEGLTVTGGINHYGKTYLDDNLRLQIPAFTFGDLGLRYSHSIKENTIIYRLNITNVTNAKYWYGGGGSSHLSLGLPRNIALTAEIQF